MIPGMTICSAVQLRQSQSEEKWSGSTYFNASGDHFAKHQYEVRRASGVLAVHQLDLRNVKFLFRSASLFSASSSKPSSLRAINLISQRTFSIA